MRLRTTRHEHRASRTSLQCHSPRDSAAPGKRPREAAIQARARQPVQRKPGRARAVSAADMHASARAGVTGTSTHIEHTGTIQRAFGKHDISGVQAYVGGRASTACAELGAEAYTVGNRVAFASEPSLHTA